MKLFIITILCILSLNAKDLKLKENNNTELMSVLGSFASSNIYLCYLNTDLISKQVINKKINSKSFSKLIMTLQQVTNQLDENLRNLHGLAESNKDASLIFTLISLTEKMKDDTENLSAYVKNQTAENLKKFQQSHKVVFSKINAIFNMKKAK